MSGSAVGEFEFDHRDSGLNLAAIEADVGAGELPACLDKLSEQDACIKLGAALGCPELHDWCVVYLKKSRRGSLQCFPTFGLQPLPKIASI
jgi:hypothetical protein